MAGEVASAIMTPMLLLWLGRKLRSTMLCSPAASEAKAESKARERAMTRFGVGLNQGTLKIALWLLRHGRHLISDI